LTADARRDSVGDVRFLVMLAWTAAVAVAMQSGVDGTWEVGDPGRPAAILIELKTDGGRLTGWFRRPSETLAIRNGSVADGELRFEIVNLFQGRPITTEYTGRISGDELALAGAAAGIERKIVAKRRAADAAPPDWFSAPAAPAEVTAWLRANAMPLDDLAALRARLKDARIVAMGEATHATHEFQTMKLRTLRMLVEELGFTVFAIESPWAIAPDADDYVQGRSDDLDAAVRHGYDWWRTEEFVELLRWMRAYNLDPAHPKKVKFAGFDIRGFEVLERRVLEYLERVNEPRRAAAARMFAELGPVSELPSYQDAPEELHRRIVDGLAAVLRRFDEAKDDYVRQTGEMEWALARQSVVVLQQSEAKGRLPEFEGTASRDRAMAENVKWIVDHEPAGTKVMLWAHNGHVSDQSSLYPSMGWFLRERYGSSMAIVGFVFGEGSFRAKDRGAERTFTVGPPVRGSLDATLGGIGLPLFAVDLRGTMPGVVAEWFAAPHRSRQIGGAYTEDTAPIYWQNVEASKAFDILIYVGKTTGTRPR
jgi:erythromycin esterase